MIHLKCLLEASETLKSLESFNLLNSSSSDLFLAFCKVINIINLIIYFKVVFVWWLLTIFMLFAFSVIFIKKDVLLIVIVIVIIIVIHTFLWHWFRLNSWETLCYLYRVNKTLWRRKSLIIYTTASCSRNNEIDTVLSSNESIASIQRVMLK